MEYSMEEELRKWKIPGCQITVARDGKILYDAAFGQKVFAEAEKTSGNVFYNTEPVTTETRFCIASCTKSFTVLIAAMLADEGLLDLDEPIVAYIPDFAMKDEYAGAHVTLRDIFLHRTGLAGHDFTWPDYELTEEDYMKNIRYLDAVVPFRTRPKYNNVMYILAGYIEKIVTGKNWGELVKERILRPLGMMHTYVSLEEVPAGTDLAEGYKDGQRLTSIAPKERASGSIVSTTEDLTKWLQFHLQKGIWNGKRLVSEKMMEMIHEPQVIFEGEKYSFEPGCMPVCYGLGWFIRDYRGVQIQYHHGGTLGFCSLQAYLPEYGISVAMLMNGHGTGAFFEDAILSTVIDRLLEPELPHIETNWLEQYFTVYPGTNHDIDLVPDSWELEQTAADFPEAFCGRYRMKGYPDIEIMKEGTKGVLVFKAFRRSLLKVTKDHYIVDGLIADTEFYRLPVSFIWKEGIVCAVQIPLERNLPALEFEKGEIE